MLILTQSSLSCVFRLDIGAGKDEHHPKCPRNKLYSQLIMYLGPVRSLNILFLSQETRVTPFFSKILETY